MSAEREGSSRERRMYVSVKKKKEGREGQQKKKKGQ